MAPRASSAAALSLDLTDAETFVDHDPHAYFREVRRGRPVYWHEAPGPRSGFWVVAGYEDVVAAYSDADALRSARGTVLDVLLAGDDSAGGKMLAVTDGPRHRAMRSVMWRSFTSRALEAVARQVRSRAQRLVREVTGAGAFDFAAEVAEHIPMNTICDLLAVPEVDRGRLLGWNKKTLSAEAAGADPLDALQARNEIVLYFMDLARERRADPGDDVVSVLACAKVDDEPFTLEEVALNCYSIMLGGDESSRVSAISTVRALAEHPHQWRALKAGQVSLDSAVEEALRWATPAMYFARTAHHDLVLGGRHIRGGDIVTLWNISANNDERVFHEPRSFDLARFPNKHVAFGHGRHFCLGAHLGRIELRALLEALMVSVGAVEQDGVPNRIHSSLLHGHSSLPVVLRAG
ncbi:cytochrome P450 [Streptomyces mirabilis]|uniref:cytochrome P450 n=1 Tax=Streptomyces mirabilis TaxID=68239 RepID=UPI00369C7D62